MLVESTLSKNLFTALVQDNIFQITSLLTTLPMWPNRSYFLKHLVSVQEKYHPAITAKSKLSFPFPIP